MGYQKPSFTSEKWDGTSPTYPSRQIDTLPDSAMADRYVSEIIAIQDLLYDAVAEIEFFGTLGSANTVVAVATDGTALKYKTLTSGNNISIVSANDTITISASEASSLTMSNNSGATINICSAVYSSAANAVTAAQANAEATSKVIGLANETINDASTGNVITEGILIASTAQWDAVTGGSGGLSYGATYYLADDASGNLTSTAPTGSGNYVTPVGVAISDTALIINVDKPETVIGAANTVCAVATDGSTVLYKTLTAGDNIGIVSANDTITITAYEASSEPVSNNSGTTINIGMAVYVSGANSITAAQANAASTSKVIGLAQEEMADSATGNIITEGLLSLTTGQWDALTGGSGGLTAGTTYYLDDATAGYITGTKPTGSGNYVTKIGTALSETTLIVDPELPETVIGAANTVCAVATDGSTVLYKTLTAGDNIGIVSANDTITITATESSLIALTNNTGGTINIGMPVYCGGANQANAASANGANEAKVIGLATANIADSASGTFQTDGTLAATTGEWDAITGGSGGLTAGSTYFLDATASGNITATAPTGSGNYVTRLGVALSTTQLKLEIEPEIKL